MGSNAISAPVTVAQVNAAISGQAITPGSMTISGAASATPLLQITNTTAAPTVAPVQITTAAAADLAIAAQVAADAAERWTMDSSGLANWGSGAGATDVRQKRSGNGILQLAVGSFDIFGTGSGYQVKEGVNSKQGIATLVAGTVTVATTAVTANSRIMLTPQTSGGTPGFVGISARVAGTSFTITSSNAGDTSTVAYQVFEPG